MLLCRESNRSVGRDAMDDEEREDVECSFVSCFADREMALLLVHQFEKQLEHEGRTRTINDLMTLIKRAGLFATLFSDYKIVIIEGDECRFIYSRSGCTLFAPCTSSFPLYGLNDDSTGMHDKSHTQPTIETRIVARSNHSIIFLAALDLVSGEESIFCLSLVLSDQFPSALTIAGYHRDDNQQFNSNRCACPFARRRCVATAIFANLTRQSGSAKNEKARERSIVMSAQATSCLPLLLLQQPGIRFHPELRE